MLSDGVLMCNVQQARTADVPASTKPSFSKLAALRMEVTCVFNPPLVWRHICHWCNCANAILSGKRGPRQHWMTCIAVLQVVSAPRLCTRTAVPVAELQVQMSSQSMKNQVRITGLQLWLLWCSTLISHDHREEHRLRVRFMRRSGVT